jgi:hypothetical protein
MSIHSALLFSVLLTLGIAATIDHNLQRQQLSSNPIQLYNGTIHGPTVSIDYSPYVSPDAKAIMLVVYFSIGTAYGGEVWIRISTDNDWHYSKVRGVDQNAWFDFSEQFNLNVGPSKRIEI